MSDLSTKVTLPPVDWAAVIDAIGEPDSVLARRIGVSRAAIHKLRTGLTLDPRFSVGCALMEQYHNAAETDGS